jgi:hypothetical protein
MDLLRSNPEAVASFRRLCEDRQLTVVPAD